MKQEHSHRLAFSIVEFNRFLRSEGFAGSLHQAMAALRATKIVDPIRPQSFAAALQAALCCSREEWERFPQLFHRFWSEQPPRPRSAAGEYKGKSKLQSRDEGSSVFLDRPGAETVASQGEGRAVFGASVQQRLRKVDFSEVACSDLEALEEIAMRLLRRMSRRLARRFVLSNRAVRVDLRRSIRRSIAHGGEPFVLAYEARKRVKRNLVILLDISGSMNFYSMFLVRFAYALQAGFERVETFLFSTSVVGVSDLLRTGRLPDALRKLSQRAAGWSGGTKIGESLRQFNQSCGRKLLTRNTVFMIFSDGWETGDPELLAEQMRAVHRCVYKLIWLNPLLGLKDYRPVTRGMAAALPYVDVFAPAHNLESLLALEQKL